MPMHVKQWRNNDSLVLLCKYMKTNISWTAFHGQTGIPHLHGRYLIMPEYEEANVRHGEGVKIR